MPYPIIRNPSHKRQNRFFNYFALPLMVLTFTLALGLVVTGITLAATGVFSPAGLLFGALGTALSLSLPTTGAFVMASNVGLAITAGIAAFFTVSLFIAKPANWIFNKYDEIQTAKDQLRNPQLVDDDENTVLPDDSSNLGLNMQYTKGLQTTPPSPPTHQSTISNNHLFDTDDDDFDLGTTNAQYTTVFQTTAPSPTQQSTISNNNSFDFVSDNKPQDSTKSKLSNSC